MQILFILLEFILYFYFFSYMYNIIHLHLILNLLIDNAKIKSNKYILRLKCICCLQEVSDLFNFLIKSSNSLNINTQTDQYIFYVNYPFTKF